MECLKNKAGVSLVTVLMFMLVATIAATAVWKFISSEGFSSASRMLKREAYQSAQAGIENARSWMTFHANDVGSLIKQFQDSNQPINIDDQLRPLQRAGQNYHVWVTGVNTENSTYKVKILSSGEARNNTQHTEVAIFNVDGLYRVEVPKEKEHKAIDFDYAYYGGTIYYEGANDVSSMLVNGNWSHNPPKTTQGDFIITGNAGLSGNAVNVAKTTCIGGNLGGYGTEKFNGIKTKHLYIGGNSNEFIGIVDSNAYFDGKVSLSTSCGEFYFQVKGNMTVADTLNFNNCGVDSRELNQRYVAGNTCVVVSEDGKKQGQIRKDKKYVELKGSAWMQSPYSLWPIENENFYSKYEKLVVGTSANDEIYIKNAKPWSFYSSNKAAKTFNEGSSDNQNMICTNGSGGQQTCSEWGTCKRVGPLGGTYKCCKRYTETGNCITWKKWEESEYSPYPQKDEKENLYFLFNDDFEDVAFRSHYNEYWKADVYSYEVGGGMVFYDLWNTWNEYNYEGGKAIGSPYCYKQSGVAGNGSSNVTSHRPSCDVKPWFKVDGSLKTWTDDKPIECAESAKDHCYDIWEEGNGCDGSKFIVRDPLRIASEAIMDYANKAPCAKTIANLSNNDLSNYNVEYGDKSLSACYSEAESHDLSYPDNKYLYNNYLVVKLKDGALFKSPLAGTKLKGKFVIIVEDIAANPDAIKLPPTKGSEDYVLLYLPKGYKRGNNSNGSIYLEGSGQFNYFIFSKKDIYGMQGKNNTLSGSIYLQLMDGETATCAKLNHLWTANLQFNKPLMTSLVSNAILCANDGSPCGGTDPVEPASSSSNSGSSGSSNDGYDHYYISVAPQLGVSLESKNKSFENVEALQQANGSSKLASSFIILPRVITLPNDPYGRLIDYFNVISLNTPQNVSPLTKDKLSLENNCTNVNGYSTLNKTLNDKLFPYTVGEHDKLPKGSYKCNISADGYDDPVPVWVIIEDKEMRSLHEISFAVSSQDIGSSETRDVSVRLKPNIPSVKLKVSCPNAPGNWEYQGLTGNSPGGTCEFTVANPESTEKTIKLFSIKTTSATSGTMNFQILNGEGYIPGSPSVASIYMSSVASLYRDPADFGQINSYCADHSTVCPTENGRYNWPDCAINSNDDKWVEPNVSGFQTENINYSWLITSAINTTVKLRDVSNGNCVVIIPENESCTFTDSQRSCTLHASAKKKVNKIKFKFKNVETGTYPSFTITSGSDATICSYSDNNEHECIVNVFNGDDVSAKIETGNSNNKDFNYWKCEGPSCPNTEKLNSDNYPPFKVSDNETVITLTFNEIDKHCFFEKFDNSAAACNDLNTNEKKEYCIDLSNVYKDAKWHLVGGSIDMLDYHNGKITVTKNGEITVMSTINADAGTQGTLKALVRLPKGDGSPSGFLFGSNSDASKYLLLHVFIDNDNYVKARVCNEASQACQEGTLTISATENDMVMIEAEISADEITVLASKGNENSKVNVKFSLAYWNGSYSGSHVGYRIATPKFVLYGIGWKSKNYECFNTYPSIKCSFAAVAQNKVVPKNQFIKPWVGYSGWEGWNKNDCTEKFYYIGSDACSGNPYSYTECGNDGYYFDATSNGKHGYTDNSGNEIKTAKVGLDCHSSIGSYNTEDMMWANDSAHCGVFWTGSQNSCNTIEKIEQEMTLGSPQSAAFNNTVNLRDARIIVDAEMPDDGEVWMWLYSEGQGNALYPSEHVSVTNTSKSFDVANFVTETGGFDPGRVKSVYFENKGNSTITIKGVSTSCETAVNVVSCRAEEKANKPGLIFGPTHRYVEISATINNRDGVDAYQINAQKNKEPFTSLEITKTSDVVSKDGTEKVLIYIPKGPGKDIDGPLNDWGFTLGVKAEGSDYYSDMVTCSSGPSPKCKIEKPGPADNSVGQDAVVFKAVLEHCKEGCSYAVKLNDNEVLSTTNCTEERCEVNISNSNLKSKLSAGDNTFEIYSEDEDFSKCTHEFTVTGAGNSSSSSESSSSNGGVELLCPATPIAITDQDPSSVITVHASIQGCGQNQESCRYGVTGYLDPKDSPDVVFSDASGSGTKTYKLKAIHKTANASVSCDFTVSFKDILSSSSIASSSATATSSSVGGGNCHCTCPSGCDDVETKGWNNGNYGKTRCYFTKTAGTYIGAYAGLCVNVNGKEFCDNWFSWSGNFDALDKKDGGWYIQCIGGDNCASDIAGGEPDCN